MQGILSFRKYLLLITVSTISLFSIKGFGQLATDRLVKCLDSAAYSLPSSTIYIQPSKGIYETGEELWFKAYILESRSLATNFSDTTLYVQLLQSITNKLVMQEKVLIINGIGAGQLTLPDTIIPGDYLLAAFTPNSLMEDGQQIKSIRKLRILKRIEPKLKVKTDFHTNQIAGRAAIEITTIVSSDKSIPIKGAEVMLQIHNGKFPGEKIRGTTDAKGTSKLMFPSPPLDSGVSVEVLVSYLGDLIQQKLELPPSKNENHISVSFFPEGGKLVAGHEQVVAFKATTPDGQPMDVMGEVWLDGKKIIDFSSTHLGMGKFSIKTTAGKQYQIKIIGSSQDFLFPEVHHTGTVLRLIRQDHNKCKFLVTSSVETLSSSKIFISAQNRGNMLGLFQGKLRNDSLFFEVPTRDYPQGLVEVTIYNLDMEPLAERLIYVNLDQELSIKTEMNKVGYGRKEKMILKIQTSDQKGNPVSANLGLSIYDALYSSPLDMLDIRSYSHLHTQIRGSIVNASYYFDPSNLDRQEKLNLLLLTQGWRKYIWSREELKSSIIPNKTQLQQTITGNIKSKVSLPKALLVITPDKIDQNSLVHVQQNGNFQVPPQSMLKANGGYTYLKPLGDELIVKSAKIKLAEDFSEITRIIVKKGLVSASIADKDEIDTLVILRKIPGLITLQQVVVRGIGTGISPRDKFMAQLDSIAKIGFSSDYVGMCGWLNCQSCGNGKKPVIGKAYPRFMDGRPPIHYVAYRAEEVVKEPYKYPVYTDEQLLVLFNIQRIQGYQQHKVFYEPVYNDVNQEADVPDFRNTLLWRPEVKTDQKGFATVELYTSDITGNFLCHIEGTGGNGLLGKKIFNFMVRKPQVGKP